jgi:hypothetical protein
VELGAERFGLVMAVVIVDDDVGTALASLRAIARPMPRAAPVTSAVRPSSGNAAPAAWDEVDMSKCASAYAARPRLY